MNGSGTIRVGAAVRVLDLPAGLPLSGYVVESRVAVEANTLLDVRALAIEGGGATAIIVSFDLLYGSASLAEQIRALVLSAHGIPRDHVLVNGTHSHCTPRDTTDHTNPELVAQLAATGAAAIADALAALTPVRVVSGVAPAIGIGRNRREVGGAVDDTAQLVLFQRPDGIVVASIVNLACHPVVLDDETAVYHPDFVGPLRALVEQSLGGICLFLQGFAGDTNPVVLDHSIPETSRVGARVGGAVISRFAELLATDARPTVYNLSEGREVPVEFPTGLVHEGAVTAASARLTAPRRSLDQLERPGATDEARRIEEWITDLLRAQDPIFNSMEMVATDPDDVPLEVQSIAIGTGLLLVAFPGEPLARTRAEVVARFPGTHVLTVGYSNGSPGYLPYRDAYAVSGYEIGCSIVAPGTAELMVAEVIDPRS